MRRAPLVLSLLAAAAVALLVGWLLVGGEEGPAEPLPPKPPPVKRLEDAPPPRDPRNPRDRPDRPPPEVVTVRVDPPPEEGPAEPPNPPGQWPGDAAGYREEWERLLRQKRMTLDGTTLPVRDIGAMIERDTGVPVSFHPALDAWLLEAKDSPQAADVPAIRVVEALGARLNVEPLLVPEGLRFFPRDRAPTGPTATASRLRWAVAEAKERAAGEREPDPTGAEILARKIDLPLDRVPLREAARRLSEALGIPVYLDAPAWELNTPITNEGGERPASFLLERIARLARSSIDVNARRVVLFQGPAR